MTFIKLFNCVINGHAAYLPLTSLQPSGPEILDLYICIAKKCAECTEKYFCVQYLYMLNIFILPSTYICITSFWFGHYPIYTTPKHHVPLW